MVNPKSSSPTKVRKVSPQKDDVMETKDEELRQTIWPIYNHYKFTTLLEENLEIITYKAGPMQETLLHR